jgi:hypothetical protein
MDFREADRRYTELKRQYDNGDLSDEEFRTQLEESAVQDAEGRWWVKHRDTGAWYYQDGDSWAQGNPYREPKSERSNIGVQAAPEGVPRSGDLLQHLAQVMNPLPPLRARKHPWLAFVLGLLLSGIGLGVYFRSWIDLIIPTVILVALANLVGGYGFLLAAVIGGVWGLLRVVNSNERSAARTQ